MGVGALDHTDPVVDRGAHDGVSELEYRLQPNQFRTSERRRSGDRCGALETCNGGGDPKLRALPENRDRLGDGRRLPGEAGEAQ